MDDFVILSDKDTYGQALKYTHPLEVQLLLLCKRHEQLVFDALTIN